METSPDKPNENSKVIPWGFVFAVVALVFLAAFIAWQMAFHYGLRQSNVLLMQSPDAANEVIQLRAQLEEARSYQTTLLNVVLASFAAGFTVLVLVNFAVVFIAQRNYDREEARMREFLILEAEKRDAAESKKASGDLVKAVRGLTERFEKQLGTVKTEHNELRGHVGDLLRHSISHYESQSKLNERIDEEAARRERQIWELAAEEAERDDMYSRAALFRARLLLAEMKVPGGYVSWINIAQLLMLLQSIEQIESSEFVTGSTLNTISDALTKARSIEGLGDEPDRGLAILEAIRERQGLTDPYVPEPPSWPLDLPSVMPPTAPLRAPDLNPSETHE